MTIQPIVEGYGDVAALPVLLRRLLSKLALHDLTVGRPIRKPRSELINETSLRKAVRLARIQDDCAAILIVFDADEDCPKQLAVEVQRWAKDEAGSIPCAVVLPKCEYEAWFLGALASLRGKREIRSDACFDGESESVRGAKERLEEFMPPTRSYSETTDQPALTAVFDLGAAHRNCRSFRRMASAFYEIAERLDALPEAAVWPPSGWLD